jgi:hypothetical protein
MIPALSQFTKLQNVIVGHAIISDMVFSSDGQELINDSDEILHNWGRELKFKVPSVERIVVVVKDPSTHLRPYTFEVFAEPRILAEGGGIATYVKLM